jgi:hypothetical protein
MEIEDPGTRQAVRRLVFDLIGAGEPV